MADPATSGASQPPPLTLLSEWADEPEEGRDADDWPYPTTYRESQANGELAERIRRALGVADDLPVYVTEEIVSGGWSEFTQEDEYGLVIRVGDEKREMEGDWNGGLVALLRWLDHAAPVTDDPSQNAPSREAGS